MHSRDDFHLARDATCQENKRGMYIGNFRMYVMAAGQHCNLWRMGNTHLMHLIAYKHIGGQDSRGAAEISAANLPFINKINKLLQPREVQPGRGIHRGIWRKSHFSEPYRVAFASCTLLDAKIPTWIPLPFGFEKGRGFLMRLHRSNRGGRIRHFCKVCPRSRGPPFRS